MPVRVKRIYVAAEPGDGKRYLVDRVWPRGVSKEKAGIDAWRKELGPSHDLRKWFGHDPSRWEEFKSRYFEELERQPDLWHGLVHDARSSTVTLVYSARNEEHNQAVALSEFLQSKLKS